MSMTSELLYRLFSDSETLHDYESRGLKSVKASDVLRRLVAMGRLEDRCKKTDSYYDGMGSLDLKDYSTMKDLMIRLPRKIASEYLINIHGTLFVREECFENWNLLKTKLSPLWVIAGLLSCELTEDDMVNRHSWTIFKRRVTRQFRHTALLLPYIPDFDYFVRQTGGLNDLHIHLNGSTEVDVIWNYMLCHPFVIAEDYNRAFYSNSKLRKHAEQVSFGFTPELLLQRLLTAISIRKELTKCLCEKYGGIDKIGYGLEDELLLYILLIKHGSLYKSERMAKQFHHYMLVKGMIQMFVVMQQSQIGFLQFQLITDNTFRHRQEAYYKKRFLQLASGSSRKYIKLIEGRFSPKGTVGENRFLIKRILSGFEKAQREMKEILGEADLVLIAHFIKRPEKQSEKEHFIKNYYLRKDLKRKAISLMTMINTYPQIGRHIKGVDAAASEFDARPEVFAPTFAFLRESGITHFTYHIGEDFSHLVSGFRAIYEAVVFLRLQSGDRLGHCTALGLSPELWCQKNDKCCYVCRGEWLDDLVFVWYLVKKGLLELSQSVIFGIESRIMELAEIIYGDMYLPHELVEAWLLRRHVPDKALNTYHPKYSYDYFQHNKVVNKILNSDNKSRVRKLWLKYHEGQKYIRNERGNRIPAGSRARYDEMIRIKSDEILNAVDLQQVQSVLLELLSEKNIIIEALPSSNMRISLYDSLRDYHLKHWLNDEGNERLLPTVVLGSDDPGIFMTNIYNEYALAYLHLKMNKYTPAKRLEKIRYIHEQSEIYCFNDGKQ